MAELGLPDGERGVQRLKSMRAPGISDDLIPADEVS